MSIVSGFILILILVIVCALDSFAEIGFAAARESRLRALSQEGDKRAARLLKLREAHTGQLISALQIALNAFSILAGIIGERFLGPVTTQWLIEMGISQKAAEPSGTIISFVTLTALFVIFSDLVPKRIAMLMPERIALSVVWWMEILLFTLLPFIWIFNGIANMILKLFGINTEAGVNEVTADELRIMLAGGEASGAIHKQEHRLIENVLALQERSVTSVMTVRDNITYLDVNDAVAVSQAKVRSAPFSYFPLCDGEIDNVIGCVRVEDFLSAAIDRHENIDFDLIKRDMLAVPDTLNIWDVLSQFRLQNTGVAVVVSEYAHVVGIVTYKDLMSALTLGIVSPFEEEYILRRDENSWLVDGVTSMAELSNALNIKYDSYDDNFETIGGLIVSRLRRAARKGDKIELSGYLFEVVDADKMRLNQLLVTRKGNQQK